MESINLQIEIRDFSFFRKMMDKLEKIETLLTKGENSGMAIGFKKVISFKEASIYTGFSKSYLYKLTSTCKIPHYKPTGKHIWFDINELENWLKQNRIKTMDEIEKEASSFTLKNRKKL